MGGKNSLKSSPKYVFSSSIEEVFLKIEAFLRMQGFQVCKVFVSGCLLACHELFFWLFISSVIFPPLLCCSDQENCLTGMLVV